MFNKNSMLLLLTASALVFNTTMPSSAAASQSDQLDQYKIRTINGKLKLYNQRGLVFIKDWYDMPQSYLLDINRKPIAYPPTEVGAIVVIHIDEESQDKTRAFDHASTCHLLPLSMLTQRQDSKKEGTPVHYLLKNDPTKEIYNIQATCSGDYGYHFEHQLDYCRREFNNLQEIDRLTNLLAKVSAHKANEQQLMKEIDAHLNGK